MSGICGICEPGRKFGAEVLLPMLDALALADESERDSCAGVSVAFGAARRWSLQRAVRLGDLAVTADADLIALDVTAQALSAPLAEIRTLPLTELIRRLYTRYGADFVKYIRGSFCCAVWDEAAQTLLLAIDRLGIKSLYWCREGNRILFASRAGAVRSARRDSPEPNPTAILQFLLFAAVPAPLTSDQGMRKLQPGTVLRFAAGSATETRYWDLEFPESKGQRTSEWARELREGMRGAVHRHLEDCEPSTTGCYLSGGTDSSSVVAFASEKHNPAQSFSIAFSEAAFSEIEFARTTAVKFGTRHHEKFLSAQDACDAMDKILAYYDEPFANSSAIGSYYCAVLAKEHGVGTLLAGDGGDELFGGNERYATDKRFALYHTLPGWLRHGVIEPVAALLPANESKLSLPRRYIRRANIPNPRRILSYGFFLSSPPEEIFEEAFLRKVGTEDWLAIPEGHFARAKATSELNKILYLDVKMTLADNDLRKVSGTAELAGVKVRYPLLDDRLAELSGRIPAALKLKGFEKRYLFKQAMQDILPTKVLYKKKHGFGVPLAQWLLQNPRMNTLMNDMLHDRRTLQRGYFRREFLEKLMQLHHQQPNFYGEIVWYLLALELWHRQHLEKRREAVHVS
jgi:asparagine synthase (glutamine-hydrolysing)